jgi:hypothetical protein
LKKVTKKLSLHLGFGEAAASASRAESYFAFGSPGIEGSMLTRPA